MIKFARFSISLMLATAACDSAAVKEPRVAIKNNHAAVQRPTPSEEQEDAERGIFHARSPCAGEIKLSKPYAVVSDLWGGWVIRAALDALDDKRANVPDEQTNPQLTFDIGNRPYGVRSRINSQTAGNLRGTAKLSPPGHDLPPGYRAWVTEQIENGTTSPTGYYYLNTDKSIALQCSPPSASGNPSCNADVQDKMGSFIFDARFPITATARVEDIVDEGVKLYAPIMVKCLT